MTDEVDVYNALSGVDPSWYTLTVEDANRIVIEHNSRNCSWLAYSGDVTPDTFAASLCALARLCVAHDDRCSAFQ